MWGGKRGGGMGPKCQCLRLRADGLWKESSASFKMNMHIVRSSFQKLLLDNPGSLDEIDTLQG